MADLRLPALEVVELKTPHAVEIGEYVSFVQLAAVGGKFYTMEGKSYCDTPLASFVLDTPTAPGYRRIE